MTKNCKKRNFAEICLKCVKIWKNTIKMTHNLKIYFFNKNCYKICLKLGNFTIYSKIYAKKNDQLVPWVLTGLDIFLGGPTQIYQLVPLVLTGFAEKFGGPTPYDQLVPWVLTGFDFSSGPTTGTNWRMMSGTNWSPPPLGYLRFFGVLQCFTLFASV